MYKIRISKSWSIPLLLIFLINISLSPTSLYFPDTNLKNRDSTLGAAQDQNPRYEYDITALTPKQRGFSKALANGIPTLTEWWNTSYDYRREVTIVEPDVIAREMEPVHLYLTFPSQHAINNSIRVALYNGSWYEEPSQVWNETFFSSPNEEFYQSLTVTFFVDSNRNQTQTYYVYYDDNFSVFPDHYTDNINASAVDGPGSYKDTQDGGSPDVFLPNGTLLEDRDLIYVNTTEANGIAAAILLTDALRGVSTTDWGGPSCSLVRATYGTTDTLNTTTEGDIATIASVAEQYMLIGDLALDPLAQDPGMDSVHRANVAPNNPREAWVPGKGVWITDDGPLFTKIKIITSDGGYAMANYLDGGNQYSDEGTYANGGDRWNPSSVRTNGGNKFVNYTITYTFYYHKNNLFANVVLEITANPQRAGQHVYFKNYGDWPHVMSLSCSGDPGTVESLQGQKAWNAMLRGLFNESSDTRRHDFPLEPWVAWYDNGTSSPSTPDMPGIGFTARTNPVGWEEFSLAVNNMGDNLVLQQILREGHQGDFYMLPDGETLRFDYFVYTSAYGRNYTDIRDLSFKVNNPMEINVGGEELYEHNILTVHAVDVNGQDVSGVNVSLSGGPTSGWGITNDTGYYQFTKLGDGTYTITSYYTIGTNTYTVNSTVENLDHTIQRAKSIQINCDLSRLQITVRNADGGNPLINAVVRMRRAPPNHLEFVENTTRAGGITNFILYNGTSSETYTVEVEYPVGRPATEVTPSTIAIPDSNQSETLDCVVATHATALNPIYPASAFVSVTPNETVDFQVRYMDTTADPDVPIDGASIYNCTLWNVTDDELVRYENATAVGNGYYNYSVDIRTLDPTKAYTLKFTLDKDSPIDYSPASFVYSISIVLIQTEFTITNPGYTWVSSVGVDVTIFFHYQTVMGIPLEGSQVQVQDKPTEITIVDGPYVTDSAGNSNATLRANFQGAWVTTFNATKQYYATGYTFFTLATGATPAHLVITNPGTPTQKSIKVGGSFILNLRYETTPAPGTGLTAESWNINVDPSGTWVPTPDETSLGNYEVVLTPPDVGTYTIVFKAKRSGYTDGVTFFTLLVKLRSTMLEITSPSAAEIQAEKTYPLKVRYTDTSNDEGIGKGNVKVAVTPVTGMTVASVEDLGGGTYLIDLRGDFVGTYTVTVTLNKPRYQLASVNFFLTVKPIPTTLNILELQETSSTTSIAQPINETFQATLSFARAENASISVENATLTLLGIEEWRMIDYLGNGTYLVEVSTGDILGIYPILVMASKSNFEVGRASFELQVRPFTTELLLWEREEASAMIPVGETLELEVYYNNTDRGVPIPEAELVISGLPLTNNRTITWEQIGDNYRVSIGTGILPETKPFTLTITGRHPPQFDPASVTFELTIIPIPFRAQNQPPVVPGAEPTLAQSISVVEDQKANVTIQLWDTYHNTPIEGAEVIWTLYVPETEEQGMAKAAAGTPTINSAAVQSPTDERASGEFEYVGNGTYIAFVPSKGLDPGTYRLEVAANKELYGEQTFSMDYVVTPKPGTPTTYFLGLASIIVGSIGSFYSWYFYFRWPPQVRYIRKALKRVEAGSQVEEGRFPSKEEHRQAITEEQLRLPRQLME
ncbi:MAG: hypothetical protein ACFFCW_11845 [Candidatus Hodarchaeota archaeon]